MKMSWREHCAAVSRGEQGYRAIEILWEDAVAYAVDWEELPGSDLCLTTTVGYLVKETKRSVTVASIINQTHIGHGIIIPKSGIISRRYLA